MYGCGFSTALYLSSVLLHLEPCLSGRSLSLFWSGGNKGASTPWTCRCEVRGIYNSTLLLGEAPGGQYFRHLCSSHYTTLLTLVSLTNWINVIMRIRKLDLLVPGR